MSDYKHYDSTHEFLLALRDLKLDDFNNFHFDQVGDYWVILKENRIVGSCFCGE